MPEFPRHLFAEVAGHSSLTAATEVRLPSTGRATPKATAVRSPRMCWPSQAVHMFHSSDFHSPTHSWFQYWLRIASQTREHREKMAYVSRNVGSYTKSRNNNGSRRQADDGKFDPYKYKLCRI